MRFLGQRSKDNLHPLYSQIYRSFAKVIRMKFLQMYSLFQSSYFSAFLLIPFANHLPLDKVSQQEFHHFMHTILNLFYYSVII